MSSPAAKSLYAGHRFPAEVISQAVWLYFRFPLSLRMVEEMLAARGIVVSHETVRQWALKFGQDFASRIRRRLPRAGDNSPLFGWLTMPLTKRAMFAPAPVTARFRAEYATAMALRPSQIRATCVDGALMVPSAMRLRAHYGGLALPVAIMAGDGDKVVSPRLAERLRAA